MAKLAITSGKWPNNQKQAARAATMPDTNRLRQRYSSQPASACSSSAIATTIRSRASFPGNELGNHRHQHHPTGVIAAGQVLAVKGRHAGGRDVSADHHVVVRIVRHDADQGVDGQRHDDPDEHDGGGKSHDQDGSFVRRFCGKFAQHDPVSQSCVIVRSTIGCSPASNPDDYQSERQTMRRANIAFVAKIT